MSHEYRLLVCHKSVMGDLVSKLVCKHCGAPIEVTGEERFVRCNYCHRSNKVSALTAASKAIAPVVQSGSAPNVGPTVQDEGARTKGGGTTLLGAFAAIAFIGAGVAFVISQESAEEARIEAQVRDSLRAVADSLPNMPTGSLGTPYFPGRPCLVAAGASTSFVVTLVKASTSVSLEAIDARNGVSQWSRAVGTDDKAIVLCTQTGLVLLAQSDFQFSLLDGVTGTPKRQVSLSDKFQGIVETDKCLFVKTADDKVTTFSSDGQNPAPSCRAPRRATFSLGAGGEYCRMRAQLVSEQPDGSRYTLRYRERGTKFLSLKGQPFGAAAYDLDLDLVCAGVGFGELSMIVTGDSVILLGGDRTDPSKRSLVGFDAVRGLERYRLAVAHPAVLTLTALDGGRVLLSSYMSMRAIEARDGSDAWTYAHKPM